MSDDTRVRYREVTVPWAAQVTNKEALGDRLVKLSIAIPENFAPAPLDTIAVEMGVDLRRYTVSAVTDRSFEIVAFRTLRGPATQFLDAVEEGDTVRGLGPERPVKMPRETVSRVIVAGDETAVGAARAIVGLATDHDHVRGGLVHEVHVGLVARVDMDAVRELLAGCELELFDNEADLSTWLEEIVLVGDATTTGVCVVGEQSVNHMVRTRATSLGVPKEHVATRTFWRPDRSGLE
jgi:NADPH-dependent ferric siderophore reductase